MRAGNGTTRRPAFDLRRRPERVTAALIDDLAGYPHGAGVEIDVLRAECGEFGPAVASGDGAQTAPPLSGDLPRKDHRHLSGWTVSIQAIRRLIRCGDTLESHPPV